jgi:hypothetical protein
MGGREDRRVCPPQKPVRLVGVVAQPVLGATIGAVSG